MKCTQILFLRLNLKYSYKNIIIDYNYNNENIYLFSYMLFK